MLSIQNIERACQLAEIAGEGIGVTLTASELRYLLNQNAKMLEALKDVIIQLSNSGMSSNLQVRFAMITARAAITEAEHEA